ncbi:hypothetical protein RCO48_37780 [Peribacillus frigoritolerans]|nr:hypothetical protein [Peribacillus frigoritolerans]
MSNYNEKVKGYQTEVEDLREKELDYHYLIARSNETKHILKNDP